MLVTILIIFGGAALLVAALWWAHRDQIAAARANGKHNRAILNSVWGNLADKAPSRFGAWLCNTFLPWLRRLVVKIKMMLGLSREPEPAPVPIARPRPAPGPAGPPPPLPEVPRGPVPAQAGGLIAPDHAAAHARIAAFEPETDAELLAFYGGETAAFAGYGKAWADHADRLLHEIGLDPAFTHVAAQLADEVGDLSHAFAIVGQRLNQVYGAVQREIAENDLVLPYDARNWLTGEGFA